ncbi:hypothetical protein [Candidatus Halobonum tyrrellensis]|uniref:Polyprenyl synthetase n=1 Tax=Candidatus Halobonum tyrrellensis G22 TaxID=1324957 RepID=V4HGX7_9EURY|nr:hypothetical protein [Candidatus Halobonum tyrrellensis]ESP87089.1 hypothetical protein K933_16267 [Candidatus Halobonum tyrrellensis G22]
MSRYHSRAERRAALDRRLDDALATAEGASLAPAVAAVRERSDRWYGQLAAVSYESAVRPDTDADVDAVLPAATAVELLREYCRLRSELLVQLADEVAHSLTHDPTAALLSSDYLHTSAYAALSAVDDDHRGDCVERLTTAASRIVEAFAGRGAGSIPSAEEYGAFADRTAGSLGAAAAAIGATVAGADGPRVERFATLGRAASAARQLRRTADAEPRTVRVAAPLPDGEALDRVARRRCADTERALDAVSVAPSAPLRELVSPRRRAGGTDRSSAPN